MMDDIGLVHSLVAVIVFWVFVGQQLAFIALAAYGARLAKQDLKTTPYGRAVAARYERCLDRAVEQRVATAIQASIVRRVRANCTMGRSRCSTSRTGRGNQLEFRFEIEFGMNR